MTKVSPDLQKGKNMKILNMNVGQLITTVVAVIMLCMTVSSVTYSTTISSVRESLIKIIDVQSTTIKDNSTKNANQDILLQEFKTKLDYIITAINKLEK